MYKLSIYLNENVLIPNAAHSFHYSFEAKQCGMANKYKKKEKKICIFEWLTELEAETNNFPSIN